MFVVYASLLGMKEIVLFCTSIPWMILDTEIIIKDSDGKIVLHPLRKEEEEWRKIRKSP